MPYSKGLEDVIACQSGISSIEGRTLRYRGYDIRELAERACFEEIVHLLLAGELPTRRQLLTLRRGLAAAHRVPAPVLRHLRTLPRETPAIDLLRTSVSMLAHFDPLAQDMTAEANSVKALRLIGVLPGLVAAIGRLRAGDRPFEPRGALCSAEHFLYALSGTMPNPTFVRIFDTWLVLHAEHTLNASTFSARVTTSTLSDLHSAVVSAIGTLKGPLHGGANQAVLEMLQAIRVPERAAAFVDDKLARHEKIMGFGHRVYKHGDPRAQTLKGHSRELGALCGDMSWYEISVEVENAVWAKLKLYPNVDFYSASVLHYLGIPSSLFPSLFAMARIAGWCAHILEQTSDNRLIRPEEEYIGCGPRRWVALKDRK